MGSSPQCSDTPVAPCPVHLASFLAQESLNRSQAETYESGRWASALLPSSLPKRPEMLDSASYYRCRHHCRLSKWYSGHADTLTGDKIVVVAVHAVIGDAIVDGTRATLVMSCMWPLEDRRNFWSPSRRGTLPPPYVS